MNWINRNDRVPDNRRKVMVWGKSFTCGLNAKSYFGISRFNLTPHGGQFDAEQRGGMSFVHIQITHWAEIEGPAGCAD